MYTKGNSVAAPSKSLLKIHPRYQKSLAQRLQVQAGWICKVPWVPCPNKSRVFPSKTRHQQCNLPASQQVEAEVLPEAESTGLKHELVRLSTNAEPPSPPPSLFYPQAPLHQAHLTFRSDNCAWLIYNASKKNYLKPVGTKGTLQPAPALETELYILVCFNASANYCTEAKPQERTVMDVPKRPSRPQQHQ